MVSIRIKIISFIVLCISSVAVSAQNKVVVVPLGDESKVAAGLNKQIQFNHAGETQGASRCYYDDATGRIGLGKDSPEADFTLVQSNATSDGSGGMRFQFGVSDNWKIYHSGVHFSFTEDTGTPTRVAYIESGTGNYVQPSGRKLKENITSISQPLGKVLALNPVTYNYKSASPKNRTVGFIAEDVAKLLPELVRYDENGDPGINYSGFGAVAIGAIKQQQQQIEELRQANRQLKERLDRLERR